MLAPPEGGLAGWNRHEVDDKGWQRHVFRRGHGPAVVVLHEVPGITPPVVELGERLVDDGFTVVMPELFGSAGRRRSRPYELRSLAQALLTRDFATFLPGRTSPVAPWLRGLVRSLHAEVGGSGVGVIGMCISGALPLAMLVEDVVTVAVISEPCTPLALSPRQRRDLGLSPEDMARVSRRQSTRPAYVMGLRFSADWLVPAARFERMRELLGPQFQAIEVPSGAESHGTISRWAHSVLTARLPADEDGHAARAQLEEVTALVRRLMRDRLMPTGPQGH